MEVLRIAFRDDLYNWRQAPLSVDTQIMDKVIKPRVLIAANIVGGTQDLISLEGLSPRYADSNTFIYEIPSDRTANREIVSVLSVNYMPYTSGYGTLGSGMSNINPNSTNDVLSAGNRLANSHSSIPVISNASAEILAYNTVLIRDPVRVTQCYQLRCMLANTENLSNINVRSHLAFSKLCELAVKSYIYNRLIISMDQAYLSGGQELGSIKGYVDNLSDSENLFQTYLLEVWQKTAFMSDNLSHTRFMRSMVNSGI